ncbi:MAG: tRNA (guanine(46)-N(7))-methyltransferase TrmB [Rickettsiales bacterium]|nr:tRNA (guanine(46)-N(7))-methyltransferase TrmB [Rickettsiales bacterium]
MNNNDKSHPQMPKDQQKIRTFGRRHGKRVSQRQQALLDNLLPVISPKSDEKAGKGFILEIGFGNGEHLREIALEHPNDIIIGAEPFINGVASLLSSMTSEEDNSVLDDYKNIRVWGDDVRKILETDSSDFIDLRFSKIYVLHPDPWPKARHEKRRLLNSEFLTLLASKLDQDGQIIIGTDHWEYYDWVLDQVKNTNLKIQTTEMDIIQTRYQKKNKAETSEPKYLVLSN